MIAADESLLVRNLRSANGTYVNGQRIQVATPIGQGDLLEFTDVEFQIERLREETSDDEQVAVPDTYQEPAAVESRWLITQFDLLVRQPEILPHFQPIVAMNDQSRVLGYEALARSDVPGMRTPREMFLAAEQLDRAAELSDVCRDAAFRMAARLDVNVNLFVNTHPAEDLHADVLPSLRRLRCLHDSQPLTVEIHEAASTDPESMKRFQDALRKLDIRLAYDDFGRSQARMVELMEAPPDYVKFDCSLIRQIELSSPEHVNVVRMLVRMIRDVGVCAIAEGIETRDTADACREMGFECAQGYLFGRPTPFADV